MAVSLKGVFLCSQAQVGNMKARGSGCTISMGSIAGKLGGIAVGAHYAAFKAGVMCLTKSLARELAPYGGSAQCYSSGSHRYGHDADDHKGELERIPGTDSPRSDKGGRADRQICPFSGL